MTLLTFYYKFYEENVIDNLEESDTQETDNNYAKEIECFP